MPSLQNSAGAGKAAKFVAANPLAPMTDPFGQQVWYLKVDFMSTSTS
jgi:hypothetical protein